MNTHNFLKKNCAHSKRFFIFIGRKLINSLKMKIRIIAKNIEKEAEVDDSETAKQIYSKLPFKSAVKTWGDEIYFEIPLHIEQASDAKADVEIGDLGFWPQGDCFCIFFGKTPASTDEKPRAASPVNVFGKVIGDVDIFKKINDGEEIVIEKKG